MGFWINVLSSFQNIHFKVTVKTIYLQPFCELIIMHVHYGSQAHSFFRLIVMYVLLSRHYVTFIHSDTCHCGFLEFEIN